MTIASEQLILKTDASDTIRIADTGVSLDSIIYAHLEGADPEEIKQAFPAVSLADIYSVIGYYLRHRDEIRKYLQRRKVETERLREEHEAQFGPGPTRQQLLERLAAGRSKD